MIYCFSGTGNTALVAQWLGKRLSSGVHRFTPAQLTHPEDTFLTTSDKLVVWMFPVYSWGVPPVVRRLVDRASMDFDADAVHVAVVTCGDDTGLIAGQWRSDMAARGIRAGAVYSVQMPNTYVMMAGFDIDKPSLQQQKLERARQRVDWLADRIAAGKTQASDDDVVTGGMAWLKTHVVYPWFVRYRMKVDGFRVRTNACVGCGACARTCPMGNISADADRHPVWGGDCAFCTACYHVCPQHAVEWKNTTLRKGRKTLPGNTL